ncbi:TMEM175 family protein [Microbacterium sp. bgisy203]|uniref:TMEM175 family protein n=1 Tax=Microbacterium sp. bgisy203 TaxID=3413799 RepID=UPI003D72CFDF
MVEKATSRRGDEALSPERTAAFIDAAVAIAMTLLVLPLMESVTDHADIDEHTAAAWFGDHQQQLISFVISFVMILMFWMIHHRLFRRVTAVPSGLMWLVGAWLLTIVWLPVATAMSGAFPADDALTRAVYIGSLLLVSVASFVIRLYLRAHPEIDGRAEANARDGLALDSSLILLFGIALVVSVLVPQIGYWSLLIMFLSGVTQRLLRRLWR